jgi:hypothetical protein
MSRVVYFKCCMCIRSQQGELLVSMSFKPEYTQGISTTIIWLVQISQLLSNVMLSGALLDIT